MRDLEAFSCSNGRITLTGFGLLTWWLIDVGFIFFASLALKNVRLIFWVVKT